MDRKTIPNPREDIIFLDETVYRNILRTAALIKFICSVGIVEKAEEDEDIFIRIGLSKS